jgi:hypothetical protein
MTKFKIVLAAFIALMGVVGCGVSTPAPQVQVTSTVTPIESPVPGPSASPDGSFTVDTVQFCPGYEAVYPQVFPEDGICINGSLYAILDQSNGYDYLTALPAGDYASEATGASCDFTVVSGCQIKVDE